MRDVRRWHWLLILAAPPLFVAAYWSATARSTTTDWIVLSLALTAGIAGIWLSPWRTAHRILATIAYIPLMGAALVAGILYVECARGHCL